MMPRVFLGLGSNVGDRLGFLQVAISELQRVAGIKVAKRSSIYETEPVGKKDQPDFLNMALELECKLEVTDLHSKCKEIERRVGRSTGERWGPREIDLDLLYYGDAIISGSRLTVPHPEIASRKFVLVPLAELADAFIDPVRGQTIGELLESCPDTSRVTKTAFSAHSHAVGV
jgi:2-amino-4-hydroxy-6-hydroxymethyldihydropteridine diphosphokinase